MLVNGWRFVETFGILLTGARTKSLAIPPPPIMNRFFEIMQINDRASVKNGSSLCKNWAKTSNAKVYNCWLNGNYTINLRCNSSFLGHRTPLLGTYRKD